MYLLEKEIISPLLNELKKQNLKLAAVEYQCGGLNVMTPVQEEENSNELVYLSDEITEQIYFLYRDYILNFGPTLNQSQILLYLYKAFFNVENMNLTADYSSHITKLLAEDVVLKFV